MKLSQIQNFCKNTEYKQIDIDLGSCDFINPATTVILGSLPIVNQKQGKKFTYVLSNANQKVKDYIANSGLRNFYQKDAPKANPNAIPFVQIKKKDAIDSVIDEIMRLAPIRMNDDARGLLVSKFYELFVNAFDHGESDVGVFCCGHWIPAKRNLVFSVFDAGIGIPHNVRKYLGDHNYPPDEAIKWAFVSGNTTKDGQVDYPRGLGLNELETFANLNHGKINLYSHDGYCYLENNERTFGSMEMVFHGTIFIMNIVADDDHIYIVG